MSNENFTSELGVESERGRIRHSYQAKFISHPQRVFHDLVVYGEEARALRQKERNPHEDSNANTTNNSQAGQP